MVETLPVCQTKFNVTSHLGKPYVFLRTTSCGEGGWRSLAKFSVGLGNNRKSIQNESWA